MNLQIVSDSVNRVGGKNYTNKFTMSLSEVVDAENNDVYINVQSVSYPLTIKNVLNDCSFEVTITFLNFKEINQPSQITFSTGKVVLPDGIYTLDKLISTLNSYVEEYDIIIEKTREGKVGVHFNFDIEYWYQQFKSSSGYAYDGWRDLNVFHCGAQFRRLNVSFTLSEKLKYMLGLDEVEFNEGYTAYWGKNLPDIMDGINKIFIHCDKVEASIVGDSKSCLLAIASIELDGQGSGGLFTYSLPNIRRELIKSKITELHLSLHDSSSRLSNELKVKEYKIFFPESILINKKSQKTHFIQCTRYNVEEFRGRFCYCIHAK